MVQKEIEIWKDIDSYEGLYQISSFGRVKSLKRRWVVKDTILNPYEDKRGYLEVGLSKGSPRVQNNIRVHSLVSSHFDRKLNKGETVNHKDGIKSNNYRNNLEIISRSDNTKHAWETGLNNHQMGVRSKRAKLNSKEVLEIRNSNVSRIKLSEIYGVSRQTIDNVINRKCYDF